MIELRNVSLRFGRRKILDDIDIAVRDKEIKVILGPSGSGKSTILKLMLGLIKPNAGRVLIDGVEITSMKESQLYPLRRKMGMVFQGNALFDSLTVSENLAFFLRENLRLPEEEIRERVTRQISFAGLEGFEHALPEKLSGGMQKRLAISRALIFGPQTIVLDEPTVGLDPVSSKRILDVIRGLRDNQGVGSVMITHIIGDVHAVDADSVAVLFGGKIIFDDAPEKLHQSDHPFIRAFLQDEETIF